MPRPRTCTNGPYGRDLGPPLPKSRSRRRAPSKPAGRRHDDWVFRRHAARHQLGAVRLVLAKKRRNLGPKRVKSSVTNLREAREGTIRSH